MKNKKTIIWIISAILIVAAIAVAVVIFRDEIAEFIGTVKAKLTSSKTQYTPEECEDFADI